MSWRSPFRLLLKGALQLTTVGFAKGPHLTRYYMYKHLAGVFGKIELPDRPRVLSISGSERLIGLLNLKNPEIVKADFPEHNLLNLKFLNDEFDLVVSDQVLEHVAGSPEKAVAESRRVTKPGGIVLHTTCLVNHVHKEPTDFWRYTPDALAWLARDFSKIIETGGWGNRPNIFLTWAGLRYQGVPEARWHWLHRIAVRNDPKWPMMTWVVARK